MGGSHRRERRGDSADDFDSGPAHHRKEAAAPDPERPAPTPAGPSTDIEFEPRTGARRLVGLLLVLSAAVAAVAAYAVAQEQTTLTVGVAVTAGVLVLVLWGVRASTPITRLAVRSGQLEVDRGGDRFRFDLSGSYTPIEVRGRPGQPGWKVLFLRPSGDPFVVDASMVDPQEFMTMLREHHRA